VIEALNPFQVEPSSIALIGKGGITETVTKNDPILFQKGLNHLIDMLSPGCLVEEEFRCRDHLAMVRVQKDSPYLLSNRAPPWFSGYFARDAFLGEIFFQALNLSGLAAALDTFESDKERQLSNPPHESKSFLNLIYTALSNILK
jgi:hypothetical protein